jgi:hypothetical protein
VPRSSREAAFTVDGTGDSEYAGRVGLKKSHRAIVRLVALSPHRVPGAPPLTALELYAKAKVLDAMYGLQKDAEPNEIELAYIRFFAGEVADFLAANQRCRHEAPAPIQEAQPAADGGPPSPVGRVGQSKIGLKKQRRRARNTVSRRRLS